MRGGAADKKFIPSSVPSHSHALPQDARSAIQCSRFSVIDVLLQSSLNPLSDAEHFIFGLLETDGELIDE